MTCAQRYTHNNIYVVFVVSGPIWIINLRHRLINNSVNGSNYIYTYICIYTHTVLLFDDDKYLTGPVYDTQMRDNYTRSIGKKKNKLLSYVYVVKKEYDL